MLENDDAVRAAYDLHGVELYRFCRRLLADSQHAEDAVQEAFIRAWRSRHTFDPARASLRTWLYSIARNVVIDMHRAQARRPALVTDLREDARSVGDHADRVLLGLQLQEGLDSLSTDQRTAVTEIAVRGRTSADVAAQLGASDSTVRSRLYYGLKAMRTTLESKEWRDA